MFAWNKRSGLQNDKASDAFNDHTIRVDALEFMRATNNNSTPNGFKTGKGGAYENDFRDKRFGRIYRVLFNKESEPTHTLQLASASDAELVQALRSDNFFWRRTAQRLLVERNTTKQATYHDLVALVGDQQADEIGLNTAAIHAIWTLAGIAEGGNAEAKNALASACEQGFKHPSSPVRDAAMASCPSDQVKAALDQGLMQDADPRVRLTAMLRVSDSSGAASGETLAAMITANSIGSTTFYWTPGQVPPQRVL